MTRKPRRSEEADGGEEGGNHEAGGRSSLLTPHAFRLMPTYMIELKNVSKVYNNGEADFFALNDVSLSIVRGEFVAIMGQSGSGKSTLMNVIGCLDKPTSGSYLLEEKPVSGLSDEQLSQVRNEKIGFVFQSFNLLFQSSALENVMLPLAYNKKISREERRRRAEEALLRVGLSDRMHHTPAKLSGGQQQRVAIARSLVNSPQIICADEPTGNLDSKSGEEILKLFREMNREGITIILVTHDKDIASLAGRVLHVRDGCIVQT